MEEIAERLEPCGFNDDLRADPPCVGAEGSGIGQDSAEVLKYSDGIIDQGQSDGRYTDGEFGHEM